jgi:DNA-binding NarL/FixJ family response regulator
MKTILLLDDHPAMLDYLSMVVLENCEQLQLLKSSNIEVAESLLLNNKVDAVICDLQIKGGKSIYIPEFCFRMNIPYMVYSSHVILSLINDLKKLDVCCYVSKASEIEHLILGISSLLSRTNYYCPVVVQESISNSKLDLPRPILSRSEYRVISAFSHGLTTNQVADLLSLQPVTIRNHRARAIEKNQCSFRELILRFDFWEG